MNKNLDKILNYGDTIQVKYNDLSQENTLNSALKNILESNIIILSSKVEDDKVNFFENDRLELYVCKENIGVFCVMGKLTKLDIEGDNAIMTVKLFDEIEHIQRRKFFRLPLLRDVKITFEEQADLMGFTQNISAGGIKCIAPKGLPKGARIKIEFNLIDKPFYFKGTALDSSPLKGESKYVIRIKFDELSERDKQAIMSSLFKMQAKNTSKSLK